MKKLLCMMIMLCLLMTSGFASSLEDTYPEQDGENDLLLTDVLKDEAEAFETAEIFKLSTVQMQAGKVFLTADALNGTAIEAYGDIGRLEVWENGACLIDQSLTVSSIPTSNLSPGVYELMVRFASKTQQIPLKITAKSSGGGGGAPFIPAPVVEAPTLSFEDALEAMSDGTDSSWQAAWEVLFQAMEEETAPEEVEEMILQMLDQAEFQARLSRRGRAESHQTHLQVQASINQVAGMLAEELNADGSFDADSLKAFSAFWNQVEEKSDGLHVPAYFAALVDKSGVLDAEEMKTLAEKRLDYRMIMTDWSFVFDSGEWINGGEIFVNEQDQGDSVSTIEMRIESEDQQKILAVYNLAQYPGVFNDLRVQTYDKKTATWKQVQSWLVGKQLQFEIMEDGAYRIIEKAPQFSDIQGHWAESIISRMNARGYIQGKSETEFDPDAIVNRAEFVTMLMNTLNQTLEQDADFMDVQPTDWFFTKVNLAAQVGIVRGNGNGIFDPYSEVTREDLVLMIARLYEIQTGEKLQSNVRAYYDMGKVSGYAKDAINGAADAGIITGVENGYFRPKDPATRADALSMIERVVDLIME